MGLVRSTQDVELVVVFVELHLPQVLGHWTVMREKYVASLQKEALAGQSEVPVLGLRRSTHVELVVVEVMRPVELQQSPFVVSTNSVPEQVPFTPGPVDRVALQV